MSSYEIVRTFHPVGQGAFYSEQIGDRNIVYDCGAMPLSKHVKSVVQSAFSENHDIDVLFISHFDYDHVSAIATLKDSVRKIKTVVIPLLVKEEIILLSNINRALSNNIINLIRAPEKFFGDDTKVIYVKEAPEENREEQERQESDVIELENTKSGEVESGSKFSFKGIKNWGYIPYNYRSKERREQLIKKLKTEGFDINKLKEDPKYTIEQIKSLADRKKLRKIYNELEGTVNENSMLVYSGPLKHFSCPCSKNCDYFGRGDKYYSNCFPACIYTGDCDLNKIQSFDCYSSFLGYVGVIQIPHHGSKASFSISAIEVIDRNFMLIPYSLESSNHLNLGLSWNVFCPISYGTKNTYGHPVATVVNALSQHGFSPLFINEKPESKCQQMITFYSE